MGLSQSIEDKVRRVLVNANRGETPPGQLVKQLTALLRHARVKGHVVRNKNKVSVTLPSKATLSVKTARVDDEPPAHKQRRLGK